MSDPAPANDSSLIYADAVLEGGGVRGIAHVGALVEAEQRGYQWVNIAGTSAGAIVASLLAAGYKATELRDIMNEVDYQRFADSTSFDWLFANKLFNIAKYGGLHSGKYIEDFVRAKLQAKGKTRFGDLIIPGQEMTEKHSVYRYRLTVIVSDISSGRLVRLPQDAQRCYGLDPDDVDIARAVHMSACIPFFFIPVIQQYIDGTPCRIVDGGLLSNFPLSIFDIHDREPTRPTFGFHLVHQPSSHIDNTSTLFTPTNDAYHILLAVIRTMLTAHDRLYMDDHTYVRTIAIPTNGISSTQFNLNHDEALQLYQNGQEAAKKFFATWNFAAYKAAYRQSRSSPDRQEQLHLYMQNISQNVELQFTRDLPDP